MVYDVKTGDLLADLTDHEQEFIAAKGGRGGRGNPHWKGPSNQAPRIAEKGVPGEEREIRLELRLIADVGIVGVPNAGKSTLLSVISNAKPKIADYPFTTLEPNLGLVVVGSTDFVVADIPGLVEGAHMGVGLGHAFLRHVQRTRVLIHLLDGSAENPLADFNQINAELALFDEQLAKKPQIVVLNKLDLPEAEAKWKKVEKELLKRGYDCFQISAATHMNTQVMMNRVAAVLADLPVEAASAVPVRALHKLDEAQFIFTVSRRDDGSYQVNGDRIERAAKMTYWELDESVNRFQKILAVTGITKALEEAGVQVGDTVHIGSFELEWSD
jgi:GTP-binding protein